ncbi:URC4/urg3 family protein [Legionella waltersii]|uniref:Putative biotin synthetase like protein n=1 Tax=Legionella waltersii TaxID=66969 RepID=A0A0W1A0L7_9GAMM|nr:URC4/urg3 family protein [Legionella waltersii]KTD74672.1 putative biotin synthetase like protein [Legionella waltersii]SNV09151.1 putative biotin synthetase like protein [Legionella waltersii]
MNNIGQDVPDFIKRVYDPKTIRSQSKRILDLAKQNQLNYFALNSEKMVSTASFVIDVIASQYPDLNIPYHSRWRHFEMDGINRIEQLRQKAQPENSLSWGKILYELVIISVLLDAGAGRSWVFQEESSGRSYSRSEGLALASFYLYQSGCFSLDPNNPFRVDAECLLRFSEKQLQNAFQLSNNNVLEGVSGRITLLNKLGTAILEQPHLFNQQKRLGEFYTYVHNLQINKMLSATQLFQTTLLAFNGIWPTRLSHQGVSLGDVWIHQALKTKEQGSEYIPFHKLTQWLTYSLIEPLEQLGITVTEMDALTGLPEYRNGGLLLDCELLQVKTPAILEKAQEPGSECIVEWRALTVALLDELAVLIRNQLNKDSTSLPLAKILQGGTWEAGRRIAKQKRNDGTPPIQIISDGTVF